MNIYATYFCNFRCPFCFLREDQKSNKGIIDFNWLDEQLDIISHTKGGLSTDFTLLGGELSILPEDIQEKLVDLCYKYDNRKPYWITNLSRIPAVVHNVDLIVSYDFNVRQKKNSVLNNILSLDTNFALSTVLTKPIIEQGPKVYLDLIKSLNCCKRSDLHILTLTPHTPKELISSDDDIIDFLDVVLDEPKVNLANYSNFRKIINLDFDNWSDRIALLPNNKYGITSLQLSETYEECDTLDDALNTYFNNVAKLQKNKICGECDLLGMCSSRVFSTECTGHKPIMRFLQERLK